MLEINISIWLHEGHSLHLGNEIKSKYSIINITRRGQCLCLKL